MNGLSLLDTLFDDNCYNMYARNPSVDVRATKNAYLLDMDLPGKTEADISLTLKEGVLTIASEKVEDKKVSNKEAEPKENDEVQKFLIKERTSFTFTRSFSLPEDVDTENINATFKNGVLTVTMPRKEELRKEKKIMITNVA